MLGFEPRVRAYRSQRDLRRWLWHFHSATPASIIRCGLWRTSIVAVLSPLILVQAINTHILKGTLTQIREIPSTS